jgi:hypothetical protein
MKRNDFVDYVQLYFTKFLTLQRGLSPNTVASYSDAISLFLVFCAEKKKIRPEKLTFQRINKAAVEEFCNWLETERNNSISTRNIAVGCPLPSRPRTNPGVRNYRTGLFKNTRIRKGIKPDQGQTFFLHVWGGLRYGVSQRQTGPKVD